MSLDVAESPITSSTFPPDELRRGIQSDSAGHACAALGVRAVRASPRRMATINGVAFMSVRMVV